ncbi:MAG: 2Fe-2S iron-sulfur cluster-binding protein [Pseudomonadota bacterium]
MPKIIYIEHDGTTHEVEAVEGMSVMNAALDNLVPGIDADCGGECSCATCHVMIDEAWMAQVGQPDDTEESMLDLNPERQSNSRLSCQIQVSGEMDGLVVNLPEFQF